MRAGSKVRIARSLRRVVHDSVGGIVVGDAKLVEGRKGGCCEDGWLFRLHKGDFTPSMNTRANESGG